MTDQVDLWNQWIADAKDGSDSFVDVGGLWGTVNEKVSVAHEAGYTSLMMADMQDEGNIWWEAFHTRMSELGVTEYKSVVTEATTPGLVDRIGRHDVVHCSGVIYHVPSPFELLWNLAACSKKYLIINSMVVPEDVKNSVGSRSVDPTTPLCVPLLNDETRSIYGAHFESHGLRIGHLNGEPVFRWRDSQYRADFAPWWWLFSPRSLREIIVRASLEVIDEGFTWSGLSYGFLLRVS